MSTAYNLLAAAGTYNYVGATSQTGYILDAHAGTYAYAGFPAGLLSSAFGLTAASGTYAYIGKNAVLFQSTAPNLTAASGTYTYTGKAAQLSYVTFPFVAANFGSYSYTGSAATLTFFAPGTFPNVVGLSLQMAEASLQASGALNPATVGYFGNWPIAVIWVQSAAAAGTVMSPGIVVGQNPVAGSQIVTNSPMTLTVIEQPTSVSYPGTNPTINNPVP